MLELVRGFNVPGAFQGRVSLGVGLVYVPGEDFSVRQGCGEAEE